MNYFIDRKIVAKKSLVIALLLTVFAGGLIYFNLHKALLDNFKTYYARSYIDLAAAAMSRTKESLAAAFGSLVSGQNQNRAVYDSSNMTEAQAVPIVSFATITKDGDSEHASLNQVANDLQALKRAGYSTVSVSDFKQFLGGTKKLAPKSFILTFDSARKDTYYAVDPILRALGYKAVLFASTGSWQSDEPTSAFMSRDEIKKAVASGRWEIGSYGEAGDQSLPIDAKGTIANIYTNKLWLDSDDRNETDKEFSDRILADLRNSSDAIQTLTGKAPVGFAFPQNDLGTKTVNFPEANQVLQTLAKMVYPLAFHNVDATLGSSWNYQNPSTWLAKRIAPKPDWSADTLLAMLNRGAPKQLPFGGKASDADGWISTWGALTFAPTLTLSNTDTAHGALGYLDGTAAWRDYFFTSTIDFLKGNQASLVVRENEAGDYAECNFSNDIVSISVQNGGALLTIKQVPNPYSLPQTGAVLSAKVSGSNLSCYVGDSVVTSTDIDQNLVKGSIGFKTSIVSGSTESAIAVENYSVTPIDEADTEVGLLPGYSFKTAVSTSTVEASTKPTPAVIKKPAPKPTPAPAPVVPQKPVVIEPATTTPVAPPPPPKPVLTPISIEDNGTSTPFVENFSSGKIGPWVKILGTLSVQNGMLLSGADASSTVSAALLEGSEQWQNYRFETILDWNKGTSVSLMARYVDDKNYTACNYSIYGAYVDIARVVDGEYNSIVHSPRQYIPDIAPWKNEKFSLSVDGPTISCFLDDAPVIHYTDTSMPKAGAVGIRTWDKDLGNTLASLHSVRAEVLSH